MESDTIYLRTDSHIVTTKRIHLTPYPYFNKIWATKSDAGLYVDEPIIVDFDKRSVKHFIEVARSGDSYICPSTEQWVFDKLSREDVDEPIIKLKVGGVLFCSTHETLKRSPFFNNCLEKFDKSLPMDIDRSGQSSKYILRFLRNACYSIPSEYYHDAIFFGLTVPQNSMISKHYGPQKSDAVPIDFSHENPLDQYLTGGAQITFFKSVYRRHTLFSMGTTYRQGIYSEVTDGKNKIACKFEFDLKINIVSRFYLHMIPEISTDIASIDDICDVELTFGNVKYASYDIEVLKLFNQVIDLDFRKLHYKYLGKNSLYIVLPFFNSDAKTRMLSNSTHFPIMLVNDGFQLNITTKTNIKYNTRLYFDHYRLYDEEATRFDISNHEYLRKIWSSNTFDINFNSTYKLILESLNINNIIIKIHHDPCVNIDVLKSASVFIDNTLSCILNPIISDSNLTQRKLSLVNTTTDSYYYLPFGIDAFEIQPSGAIKVANKESITCTLELEESICCKSVTFIFCHYSVVHIFNKVITFVN
jgi:hypothetical protein